MTQQIKYKRVLLKLSGESLMGSDPFGINHDTIVQTVGEIAEVVKMGVQVGIVVGGGNIFRGVSAQAGSMDRATADYMGMMATVMNALALKDAFETLGIKARVQSALSMQQIAETYARPKAIQYLEEGKVVIFAAGTGNPFFTTDTAAALRGAEMNCDVMLKATNVDGVYTADPKKDPSATRSLEQKPQSYGRDRLRPLPRTQTQHRRLRYRQTRLAQTRRYRRRRRHAGSLLIYIRQCIEVI